MIKKPEPKLSAEDQQEIWRAFKSRDKLRDMFLSDNLTNYKYIGTSETLGMDMYALYDLSDDEIYQDIFTTKINNRWCFFDPDNYYHVQNLLWHGFQFEKRIGRDGRLRDIPATFCLKTGHMIK